MKTKSELRRAHGMPAEFEEACKQAWIDGYISFQEAVEASDKYANEYAAAPGDDKDAPRAAIDHSDHIGC